jgi:large subunit ribosomal protein L28
VKCQKNQFFLAVYLEIVRMAELFIKNDMSRVCEITGKRPSVGNNRSHAMNATKRRFLPNLVTKRIFDPKTGKMRKMTVATSALRTLVKVRKTAKKK